MPATIIIPGNITRDAQVRQAGQSQVVSFSVVVNVYNHKTRKKDPIYYDVSWFGPRAVTAAQYLTKGSRVTVTGAHSTREHQGKTYEQCDAWNVELMGGGQRGGSGSAEPAPAATGGGGYPDEDYGPSGKDEDFPFD